MKPFGFRTKEIPGNETIFGFYGGTFFCLPQKLKRLIPCSGSLKPCNPIRNYNQPSDLDLIMFIITSCSLLFGAFLAASFPHSVSSLDEDNTSFYRNICDEVLGLHGGIEMISSMSNPTH